MPKRENSVNRAQFETEMDRFVGRQVRQCLSAWGIGLISLISSAAGGLMVLWLKAKFHLGGD